MATINDNPPQYVVQQGGIPKGCLYGCGFAVVGVLALMLCGGVGTYFLFTAQVEKYTSDVPAELPRPDYTQDQLADLQKRVDSFNAAVEEGEIPDEDLVLSADEINMLIDQQEPFRGKVYAEIADGQITGEVSIPADAVPGGKGRYFNGSGSFEVDMVAGDIFVTLVDAEVNGEPLPQPFIEGMSQQNLAREMYNDPDMRKRLRRFESISISGDKIILKVRRDQAEAEEDGAEVQDTDDSSDDDSAVETVVE